MLAVDNLKSILKILPISTVVTLPNGPAFSTIYVNDAYLGMTNAIASNVIQRDFFDLSTIASDDFNLPTALVRNLFTEAVSLKKSGQLFTDQHKISVTPQFDAGNAIEYLVVTFEPLQHSSDHQPEPQAEKYEDLFNCSPLPHWVYNLDTLCFLDVNDAAIKHYGYTREEFLSMTLADIRPPEDISILTDILGNTREKGTNTSTVRHQKKNGDIISVVVQGNSIRFQNQDARLVLAIDHTEKIKAENALEASERRFKALVQDGSDLIAILDIDGFYRYVNPTSKSILGLEMEFFIGKNVIKFIHEEDQELVIEQLQQLRKQQRVRIAPYRFRIGNDQYRWLETTVTDLTNDPAIAGFVANSRDVTKQIEYEQKMEESIARFGIVSKATSDAIWDRDILNDKLTWNKGIKGIFGHNKPTSTYKWWHSHVHPDDVKEVVQKIQLLIKNKESRISLEYRFRCAGGNYKYINDRAFLLFDSNGEAIRMIGSMRDITERINYIQAMEQQNNRLRDISWMQSHHVRAPLARILGLTNLLSIDNNSREEAKEFLRHLTNSSTELDRIIREIVKKTEGF